MSAAAKLRVLVVEDESLISMMIEDLLAELGIDVVGPAATVEQALRLLETTAVDAALLDMNLGQGVSAEPIAQRLQSRQTPFAFLTGYGTSKLTAAYPNATVLTKPVDLRRLQTVMERLERDARIGSNQVSR